MGVGKMRVEHERLRDADGRPIANEVKVTLHRDARGEILYVSIWCGLIVSRIVPKVFEQ